MKVEVKYGMGFKGSYCYVRCPKCGEINVVDNTDDIILEDTEERCTECGALLTIVWRTDEQKERIRKEMEG